MSTELEQRVIKVIADNLNVDKDSIKPESQLVADLGADSLDNVELIMAFEEEFDIQIPDDVAENIRTVRDLIELVASQTAAA